MANRIGSKPPARKSSAASTSKPSGNKQPTSTATSAATKPSPAATASTYAAAQAQPVVLDPQPKLVTSALRFDASNPEIRAFAQGKGWDRPGLKTTVYKADLVYTTDGWKTTHTAPLQYLLNGHQGFVLRDVPQGTQIEWAVHAELGVSHDNFYSFDERADLWANNGGRNYVSASGDVTGA